MGKITELSRGNLDGLKKQVCECIDHAQAEGYKRGYTKGKNDGHAQGCNTQSEYDKVKIDEAKQDGYNQGYADGKKEPREVKVVNVEDTNEYQIGYKVGREDGYNKGIADSKDALFTEEEVNDIANKERQYGYNQGLEDASNLIAYGDSKFVSACYPSDADYSLYDLNAKCGLADIVEKFKAYEEKKKAEEIKVGDIVKFNKNCHSYDTKENREFLVLHKFDNGIVTLLYDNGDTGAVDISLLDKTGRHIDETEQLLNKLKGDKE